MHPRPSLPLRRLSQAATLATPQATVQHITRHTPQPYFVPRNANGNLPVYSDIRNNGTQQFVHIRGVDGQAHILAQHLRTSLSTKSPLKISIQHARNIVISGTSAKNQIIEWLKARGF